MSTAKQTSHSVQSESRDAELQQMLDEALAMTFPASDPVAICVERRPADMAPPAPSSAKDASIDPGKGPKPRPVRA